MEQRENHRVKLQGLPTYEAGFRGGHLFGFYGSDATDKANAFAKAALSRSRNSLQRKN